jgi:hypothetical protein
MRRVFAGAVLLVLALALAACSVTIVNPIKISNLSVKTNHSNGAGGYYVCTNLPTQMQYSFDYTGPLSSWTQKVTYQDVHGNDAGQSNSATLTTDSSGVFTANGMASYSFTIKNVPLGSSSQSASTQAIVTNVGTAYLNINANGSTLKAPGIIVNDSCSS